MGAGLTTALGGLFAAAPGPVAEPVVTGEPYEVLGSPLTRSAATATTWSLAGQPVTAFTTEAFAAQAAGFHVTASGAHGFGDSVSLRGQANTPIFGTPAVTLYLDEIPLGPAFTGPAAFTGFASAELARGATPAARFGRAGPAGVLLLRSPAPGESAAVVATAGGGSDAAWHGAWIASTAAVGTTKAEGNAGAERRADALVSLSASGRDGYVFNSTLGRDVDARESFAGLARVRLQATDTLELTLVAHGERARDGGQPLVPLGGPWFEVERSEEGTTELDAAHLGLTAAWTAGWGRLRATTSATDWELAPYRTVLAFGPGVELGNDVALRHRQLNQEIVASSAAEAVRPWQLGVFASEAETEGGFARSFGGQLFESSIYTIDARDLATFGELTLPLSDGLRLIAGLRAERARRTMDRREVVPSTQRIEVDHTSTALLPQLTLAAEVAPRTTLTAALGSGFKPGGFSSFTGRADLAAFGAERTRTLELAATHHNAAATLHTTLRAYGAAITGYQIERSFATGALADDYLVVNAPRARALGLEWENAWTPAPGWRVAVVAGLTRATLRDFTDPYSGDRFDGARAPYVPDWDARLDLDYRAPAGWFAGASLSGTGRTRYTESGDATFAQGSYAQVEARLGYERGRWRVLFSAANLTDERYYASITPGTFHGTPGAPRTWSGEVTVRF